MLRYEKNRILEITFHFFYYIKSKEVSRMSVKQLHSIEEMQEFVKQPGKHLLFKHSTTCPISAKAHDEFQAFVEENNPSAAIVHVIEDRPVSNQIAEDFGIKHESPQIFLIENGEVRWNSSHWKITQSAIKEALGE
jgi:bacillithiol system protein YtxJ